MRQMDGKSKRNWTLSSTDTLFVSRSAIFSLSVLYKQRKMLLMIRSLPSSFALNLVPRMLEMALQSFQISKFSGGACPQTPLSEEA